MKFGCCETCAYRDTDACDECEDADQYEFDTDLLEEEEEDSLSEMA